MSSSILKPIRFVSKDKSGFGPAVKKRVAAFLNENGKERTGDYRIWIKVIVLPLIYLVPFAFLFTTHAASSIWLFYGLWVMMGVGVAGCGLGIMHDACHGAISKNKTINRVVGMVLNLFGGHVLNWKIQHNVLHHSYTNIDGYDEDLDPSGVMRFSPHQPIKPFFKYQVYYAWFFYGLMTFSWATFKDFSQLKRYKAKGLIESQGTTYNRELMKTLGNKLFYYTVFIVAPLYFIDVAWYHVFLGWFAMQFVSGLILACIFQPAHVMPSAEYPLPDRNNNIDGDREIYQLLTTSNFAPSNRILSWYVGGLNYQIEHHLFPTMSHVHHRSISHIVKETAEEFGLPYYSEPTFFGALKKHASMLRKLGK